MLENNWKNGQAAYLKAFRDKHHLSQKDLADYLEISKRRIEDIEQSRSPGDALFPRALRDLERELLLDK